MIQRRDVLYITAQSAMISYFNLWDAIVDYALAVARDIQSNGRII